MLEKTCNNCGCINPNTGYGGHECLVCNLDTHSMWRPLAVVEDAMKKIKQQEDVIKKLKGRCIELEAEIFELKNRSQVPFVATQGPRFGPLPPRLQSSTTKDPMENDGRNKCKYETRVIMDGKILYACGDDGVCAEPGEEPCDEHEDCFNGGNYPAMDGVHERENQ